MPAQGLDAQREVAGQSAARRHAGADAGGGIAAPGFDQHAGGGDQIRLVDPGPRADIIGREAGDRGAQCVQPFGIFGNEGLIQPVEVENQVD